MYGHNRSRVTHVTTVWAVISLFASSCGWTPPVSMPLPEQMVRSVLGGYVRVSGFERRQILAEGELISVSPDSIYVAEFANAAVPQVGGLVVLARSELREVVVSGYDTGEHYGSWTAAGVVGSLTHGWVFLISAPVWIFVGTVASVATSGAGLLTYRASQDQASKWTKLRTWARYPQGMPPCLDRSHVRSQLPAPRIPTTRWPAGNDVFDG